MRIDIDMMDESQIIERLSARGLSDEEVRMVIRDVNEVIFARAAAAYLERFPEGERAAITSLDPAALEKYLAEHKTALPPFPQSAFDAIHDSVWEDYFKAVA